MNGGVTYLMVNISESDSGSFVRSLPSTKCTGGGSAARRALGFFCCLTTPFERICLQYIRTSVSCNKIGSRWVSTHRIRKLQWARIVVFFGFRRKIYFAVSLWCVVQLTSV